MGTKTFTRLAGETLFVGIGLVILFIGILLLTSYIQQLKDNHPYHMVLSAFLAGGLFHLICEWTGLNVWYSKDYCKTLDFCVRENK